MTVAKDVKGTARQLWRTSDGRIASTTLKAALVPLLLLRFHAGLAQRKIASCALRMVHVHVAVDADGAVAVGAERAEVDVVGSECRVTLDAVEVITVP